MDQEPGLEDSRPLILAPTRRPSVCPHVLAGSAPIASIRCDGQGNTQVFCGGEDRAEDFAPTAWGSVLEREPSLAPLQVCVQPGYRVHRASPRSPWMVDREGADRSFGRATHTM